MREKLRDRVYTVSVPQLSLHIPRDSLPIHLGGTLRIDHSTWLLYCSKSMTNREEDELLSQQEVVGSSGGGDDDDAIVSEIDQLNNGDTNTTPTTIVSAANGSNELDSETTINGSNDEAATATQNGTNITSSATEIDVVGAGQEETNGIITEIHWNENLPSSASPSSGFSDDDSLTGANESGDPKTIEQIVDMVRSLGRKGLLKEYAEIRARQPDGTFDHAKLRNNLTKNRYTDVLCYDHSRVVLSHDVDEDDPTNDYINANFVDGYKQKNAYISTQGNLNFTFSLIHSIK